MNSFCNTLCARMALQIKAVVVIDPRLSYPRRAWPNLTKTAMTV